MPGKIERPHFEKLEAEFIQGGGEWKEVEIQELFDIHPTKNYGMTNTKLFATKGRTPVIVNSSFNNGIGGYVDLKPLEKGGIITFSDTTTADSIFYQKEDFIGYSHVQGLYPYDKKNWSEKSLMYFCVAFRRSTRGLFDYGNKFNRKKAKKILVILPYINDKPAYSFMEKYIEEIERGVFEKIDAYLEKNELKLCQLTAEEKSAFEMFDEGASIEWKRVRIGDVFEIKTPKAKFNAMSLSFEGEYPYIARGGGNNGIKGYITEDEKYLNDGNTISFGQDTSTMFYQQAPYFTGDKIKILKPKDFILNKYIALYYIASAKKKLKTFKWGSTSFKVENLENIELEIPIYKSLPNHQFMKNFIRAIEKLIMRKMVMYLNEKIKIASESQKKI